MSAAREAAHRTVQLANITPRLRGALGGPFSADETRTILRLNTDPEPAWIDARYMAVAGAGLTLEGAVLAVDAFHDCAKVPSFEVLVMALEHAASVAAGLDAEAAPP